MSKDPRAFSKIFANHSSLHYFANRHMNSLLQGGLIRLYRLVKATGGLDTAPGRRIFEASYLFYKDRLEAGPIGMLRTCVRPRTLVIDVGANIGYFARRFATWVSEGGWVLAVEPEAMNFARLQRAVTLAGLTDIVETVQAAVAERTGEGFLEINPGHPGDHRLGAIGIPVALTTIDDLLAARGWPEVSLIKVDVQGAEARVLAGARRTLERFRPALFLEVDDRHLRRYGSSAGELLNSVTAQGYSIRARVGKGISGPMNVEQALGEARNYQDLLLLPARPGT